MPEEELDNLFRKSASEFHPEYDPAAWEAMEKKLDANPPVSGFRKRLGWLSALFLTLGLGLWMSLVWLRQEQPEPPVARQSQAAAPEARKPAAPARPHTGPAAAPEKQPDAQPPQASASQPAEQAALQPAGQQERLTRTSPAPLPGNRAKQGQPQAATRRRSPAPVLQPLPSPAGEQAGSDRPLPDKPAPALAGAAGEADRAENDPAKADSAASRQAAVIPAADTLAAQVAADSSATAGRRTLGLLSRLGLRLLVAPDLSTVGFSRPEGLSTNVGLELSYQLRPRWRLATGLLLANKVYAAEAEDYGDEGYWYSRKRPDDIDAVCQVLDIPLNIGYQLFSRGRAAVTLNTGLSSYFMLSEAYEYYYRNGYGTPYSRTWEVKNQNRHLFSIYNLSGLYSHRLTPAMALGVEPFVKVPLTGVGAGRVKLASGGVFFSLSYQFR